MASDLGTGGAWIEKLVSDQRNIALDYPQDELITSFPDETHDYDNYFGYEIARRKDPDQENEDSVNHE